MKTINGLILVGLVLAIILGVFAFYRVITNPCPESISTQHYNKDVRYNADSTIQVQIVYEPSTDRSWVQVVFHLPVLVTSEDSVRVGTNGVATLDSVLGAIIHRSWQKGGE